MPIQTEYMELLLKLIQCRPLSSDIPAVNRAEAVMKEFLEARGIYCVMEEIDGRSTLYASTRPGNVQDVLLNAHMDIVPAVNESQYTPYEKDGWLYARGSCDCLGNAVCIASILEQVKDSAAVGAIFTSDEEIGGFTTGGMIERGYGARHCALVMDGGGDGNIIYAQKGILVLQLTARGCGGHASRPWALVNPIDRLIEGYRKLAALWRNPDSPEDWKNSMAACVISGGMVENQVPDTAEMLLNFRYIADEDYQKIIDLVKDTTGLEVAVVRNCPPVTSDTNAPVLKLLQATFQQELQRPVNFIRMCGATDARHLKFLHIPVAISGVTGEGAHSAEERVEIDSINQFREMIVKFAVTLKSL